jgi:transposase
MTELKGRSIGIDLHPDRFNTAEIDMRTGELHRERYEVREGVETFSQRLNQDDVVVMEATTNTFAFARKIQNRVKRVIIIHPGENRDIIRSNKKTDKIDALKLGKIGIDIVRSGREVKQANMPEESVAKLRALFTTYELISKKVTMSRCRIHSLLTGELRPFVKENIMCDEIRVKIEEQESLSEEVRMQIKMMYAELDLYYNHIEQLKKEIIRYARNWPEEIRIMISMDGISILVALALKADYGDIDRFENGAHLCSYLRTAPTVDESNGKVIYGPVNKRSRHLALGFLLQVLHHYYGGNQHLREWRETRIKFKSRGKIRIAIARKMLMCLYAMLTKKEFYRFRNPMTFARKEKELDGIMRKAA